MSIITTGRLALLAAAVSLPAVVGAAPLRAGAALPSTSRADSGAAARAATPIARESALSGFPIFAFVGLFVGIGLAVVVVSGGGRSPG